MLGPVDACLQELLDGRGCSVIYRNPVNSLFSEDVKTKLVSDCGAVLLGSLFRSLVRENLFPVPDGSDVFESTEQLGNRLHTLLTDLAPLGWLDHHKYAGTGAMPHTECSPFPSLRDITQAAASHLVESWTAWDQEDTIIHLLRRAERTGCPMTELQRKDPNSRP